MAAVRERAIPCKTSLTGPRRALVTWRQPCRLALAACFLLLAGGVLWAGGCSAKSPQTTKSPTDRIVATVNGRPIRQSQVQAVIAEARLINQSTTEKQALDGVIDEELLRQEAERLGVAPPPALVEARLRALERRVGGATALDEALKGVQLTRAQLRERLAVVVLGERVAAAKFPKLSVTRRQAEAYYRTAPLRVHVTGGGASWAISSSVRERMARGAIQRIRGGQSFYETAKTFNRDPELKRAPGAAWLGAHGHAADGDRQGRSGAGPGRSRSRCKA